MTSPHRSKVAGFQQAAPPPPQTASPPPAGPTNGTGTPVPADPPSTVQGRLASWVTDLTSLHELTGRLAATDSLDDALQEVLRAGAALVGARRGLLALDAPEEGGTERTFGLGLGRADLGQIETVPRSSSSYARLLDGLQQDPATSQPSQTGTAPGGLMSERPAVRAGRRRSRNGRSGWANGPVPGTDTAEDAAASAGTAADGGSDRPGDYREILHRDIASDEALDPRHREVAASLGYAASYAVPLGAGTEAEPHIGAAVWLYDEPTEPSAGRRHLLGLYLRCAGRQLARHLELSRNREEMTALHNELLPSRLPRVPGVSLAHRHHTGTDGGGDWYEALPLPEGALGLTVGGVTGSGPGAVAARIRLQASLRAYAVMEGEDPVAVLSDLELLLRLTEPARAATALFAYAEPATRRVVIAGAGHCPPLLVGPHRTEFVETTLSAPLGMLACWEAPSVEVVLGEEETLLLYTDGLLHRTGEETDRAFARLHAAAAGAPPEIRADPDALAGHVLQAVLPAGAPPDRAVPGRAEERAGSGPCGSADEGHPEDIVLLAARF